MTPQRIQLSRRKGWRKPEGAVLVSRPSRWGNPFEVWKNGDWWADRYDPIQRCMDFAVHTPDRDVARRVAADAYRAAILDGWDGYNLPSIAEIREALAGKDLACWCPLVDAEGKPVSCHADFLLQIANGTALGGVA